VGDFGGGFAQGFGQQFQAQQDRALQGEALRLAQQRFKLEEKERGIQIKVLQRQLERDPMAFLQGLGLVQPTPTGDLPQAPASTTGPALGTGMGGLELGGVDVTEAGDIRAQFRRPERQRPVAVGPGAALVDPTTGQPIFTAPERPDRPVAVGPGGILVDPKTGRQIFQAPERPMTVGPGGALVDPRTGRPVFQAEPAPQGPGGAIVGLAKSLRQQGLLQNDLEEAEFIQQFAGRPDLTQLLLSQFPGGASAPQGAGGAELGGIGGTLRQRVQEQGAGQAPPPQAAPSRTNGGPPKGAPPRGFTTEDFPPEIQTVQQAVRFLMVRFGMSQPEAEKWFKENIGASAVR